MRLVTTFCALILVCAAFGQTNAEADKMSVVAITIENAVIVDGVFVGENGVLCVDRMVKEPGVVTYSVTAVTDHLRWMVTDMRPDEKSNALSHAGAAWTGLRDGKEVKGTIRVFTEAPFDHLTIQISESSGRDTLARIVVHVSPTETNLHAVAAVWPFKAYCGCNNLNTLCASDSHCTYSSACPSTPGQVCHWYIIFDPWTVQAVVE